LVAYVAYVAPSVGLFMSRLLELAETPDAWDPDHAVEQIKATLARVELLAVAWSNGRRTTLRNMLADRGARLDAICLRRDRAALERALRELESAVSGLR